MGAITLYDEAMTQLAAAVSIGDLSVARQAIEQLNLAVEQGAFGPIATEIGLFGFNLIDTIEGSLERIDGLRGELEQIARDPNAQQELMNAWRFYHRAYAALRQLPYNARRWFEPQEFPGLMLPGPPRPDGPLPNEPEYTQSDSVDMAGDVFDLLERAALITHCEFTDEYNRRAGGLWPNTNHTIEMEMCLNLVVAGIERAIEVADGDAARRRVLIALAMIDHLAQDELIESSTLAHTLGERLNELCPALAQLPATEGDAHFATVGSISERFHANDPFGFERATRAYAARARPLHRVSFPPRI